MTDAGLLTAAFHLSVLVAGTGAVVCVALAARAGRTGAAAATHELTWALVPAVFLVALLSVLAGA